MCDPRADDEQDEPVDGRQTCWLRVREDGAGARDGCNRAPQHWTTAPQCRWAEVRKRGSRREGRRSDEQRGEVTQRRTDGLSSPHPTATIAQVPPDDGDDRPRRRAGRRCRDQTVVRAAWLVTSA